MSVRSLAWTATSEPAPIEIPRSAEARAAASFTPSPTIATCRPSACRSLMSDNFSEGLSSAYTSSESIPTSWAMTSATARRSPVAIRGLIPRAFISAIASALEIFARSATKIVPTSVPSTTTSTPVSVLLDGSAEVRTSTMTPPTAPRTPKPGMLTASTATGSSPSISCRAASTIARAIGCWCDASTAPAW